MSRKSALELALLEVAGDDEMLQRIARMLVIAKTGVRTGTKPPSLPFTAATLHSALQDRLKIEIPSTSSKQFAALSAAIRRSGCTLDELPQVVEFIATQRYPWLRDNDIALTVGLLVRKLPSYVENTRAQKTQSRPRTTAPKGPNVR